MGRIEGVVTARAAWKDRLEVVELSFDPEVVSYADLVRMADGMDCATAVFAHDAEQLAAARERVGDRAQPLGDTSTPIANTDAHQFRHLRATPMFHLPLTDAQANKVNASLQADRDPRLWLSPRQLATLDRIRQAIDAGHVGAFADLCFPEDPGTLATYSDALQARLEEVPGESE